ncbi:hypothetical protein ABGV40_12275 [Paenibacillus amylolyticus]
MDGEANVRAGLLQQEGSNKAPVHVADLPPEPEPPLMPIEEYEAAQAAAAAEAAAVTQASTTNPKDGSLAGAALAITAMIPILGALGGIAAQTAIGVGIAAVATGLIASVPKLGSFKPSALNLLDRFTNGFAELQQQENEAKWTMLGKMLTAAKELTTSTSVTDFFKKLEQQNKEISLAYEQIPSYFREKWAHEKAQRDLQKSLEFFKSVEKDDVQHQTFFSPYYQEISWALDRAGIYHNITVEEVKDYDFWLRQDLTLEQMKYLTQLIYNPISDEKFVEMIYDYEMHRDLIENGTMIGGNLRVRTPDIEGKVMQVVGNGLKTAATFAKKKWTDGQKMRIVSGGGSDWSGDKSKKTGQASSGGKTEGETETKPNQAGSDQKPKQKPENTQTKTNPEKDATPNEVNSWKKSLPNKVEVNSEADTKPPKPPKPEGEQDTNKPKENKEGTEGTGRTNILKNVTETENNIKNLPLEHGQFFDKHGNLLGDIIIGTESAINLNPYRHLGKDAIFTHNHPKNGSFSIQDMETAVDFNMAEMRAVTPNGKIYIMKRGTEGWKVDGKHMEFVYQFVQTELKADPTFNNLYKAGMIDKAMDIYFQRIAERIGGIYNRY